MRVRAVRAEERLMCVPHWGLCLCASRWSGFNSLYLIWLVIISGLITALRVWRCPPAALRRWRNSWTTCRRICALCQWSARRNFLQSKRWRYKHDIHLHICVFIYITYCSPIHLYVCILYAYTCTVTGSHLYMCHFVCVYFRCMWSEYLSHCDNKNVSLCLCTWASDSVMSLFLGI